MTQMLLDRYLAFRIIRPFGAVLVIMVMLLSLENAARLMADLGQVQDPASVLVRSMAYLLPEYLGVALIFALFIGIAMGFRALALTGEYEVFAAIGASPMRIMRVPLLIAAMSAALILLTRGYLEPWGERQLDRFGRAIQSGELGITINAGEFYTPSPAVTFYAEQLDRKHTAFANVMMRSGEDIIFANSGRAVNGGSRGISLVLQNGQILRQLADESYETIKFKTVELPLTGRSGISAPMSPRDQNARRFLDELLALGLHANAGAVRLAARAGVAVRFSFALMVMILPFLAVALAIPAKRQSGMIGIGVGVLLIIGFIQTANAIEESAARYAPFELVALLSAMALASSAAWYAHTVLGPGIIEHQLQMMLTPLRRPLFALFWSGRLRKIGFGDV